VHPGELVFHFVNTIIITACVAAFVLWRYRASVLAGMRVRSSTELAFEAPLEAPVRERAPAVSDLRAWERAAHRRIAAAALTAVGVSAVPLAVLWLHQSGEPITPLFVLVRAGGMLMAAVPIIAVNIALSWPRALWLAVRILAACALAVVVVSALQRLFAGRAPTWDQLLNIWYFLESTAIEVSVPMLLLLATGAPRIRGVAPITFVGLFVFGLAPLLGSRLTTWLTTTRSGTDVVLQVGANAAFMALALPTAWLAWRRLRAVAVAFERKRLSDVELLVRVWWLMFCATIGIELVNVTGRWVVPLVGAGLSYLAFAFLYHWLALTVQLPAPRPPRRTLLLLRVFDSTARTERLFDRVAARWRLFGPITVIAAPDVVARTVDPGDFLRFVTGHLAASFVTSETTLEARLAALDLKPDRNGRFRINEFCCQDQTWRATVVALMHRADAVIMDLRGLTPDRAGVQFELQQLATRVDHRRVVLVVDKQNDAGLDMIARSMGLPVASSRTFTLSSMRDVHTDRVFDALLEAGYG
jgi:hypothetical protein